MRRRKTRAGEAPNLKGALHGSEEAFDREPRSIKRWRIGRKVAEEECKVAEQVQS